MASPNNTLKYLRHKFLYMTTDDMKRRDGSATYIHTHELMTTCMAGVVAT